MNITTHHIRGDRVRFVELFRNLQYNKTNYENTTYLIYIPMRISACLKYTPKSTFVHWCVYLWYQHSPLQVPNSNRSQFPLMHLKVINLSVQFEWHAFSWSTVHVPPGDLGHFLNLTFPVSRWFAGMSSLHSVSVKHDITN